MTGPTRKAAGVKWGDGGPKGGWKLRSDRVAVFPIRVILGLERNVLHGFGPEAAIAAVITFITSMADTSKPILREMAGAAGRAMVGHRQLSGGGRRW